MADPIEPVDKQDRLAAIMAGLIDDPNAELTPEILARIPRATPGQRQYPWSDPVKNIMSGIEGLPMGRGMMAAPGALKAGLAEVLARVPKPAAAGVPALAATLAGTGDAGSEEPTPMQRLYEQQSAIQRQAEEARLRREAQRPKGRAPSPATDPQFSAADQEFQKLQDQLTAIGRQIETENNKNSPEFKLRMQKEEERAAEERKAREASTPFRERYPGVAGALPAIGIGLSAGLPFALKGKGNMSSFYPGSYAGQMRTAVGDAEAALKAGDAAQYGLRQKELVDLLARQPTMKSEVGKTAAAAGSGGALAAEGYMFPDQYDAYNLPAGSPAQVKARERATNPLEYGERALIGALTGASGYKFGGLVPSSGAPLSRATAITQTEMPSAAKGAPVAQTVVPALGKLPAANFQPRKGGRFSGPPEYPPGHPKYDPGE